MLFDLNGTEQKDLALGFVSLFLNCHFDLHLSICYYAHALVKPNIL